MMQVERGGFSSAVRAHWFWCGSAVGSYLLASSQNASEHKEMLCDFFFVILKGEFGKWKHLAITSQKDAISAAVAL